MRAAEAVERGVVDAIEAGLQALPKVETVRLAATSELL